MKLLTPIEWARMRDRILTLSLADHGPVARAQRIDWLLARPGTGWFYVLSDNYHFGAQADADAFRQWMMQTAV